MSSSRSIRTRAAADPIRGASTPERKQSCRHLPENLNLSEAWMHGGCMAKAASFVEARSSFA